MYAIYLQDPNIYFILININNIISLSLQIMASAHPWPGEIGETARDATGHTAPHSLLKSCHRNGK